MSLISAFTKIERKPSLFLKDIFEGINSTISKNLIEFEESLLSRKDVKLYKNIVETTFIFVDKLEELEYPIFENLQAFYKDGGKRKFWNEYEIERCQQIVLTK